MITDEVRQMKERAFPDPLVDHEGNEKAFREAVLAVLEAGGITIPNFLRKISRNLLWEYNI
jgi:hypothetical protein